MQPTGSEIASDRSSEFSCARTTRSARRQHRYAVSGRTQCRRSATASNPLQAFIPEYCVLGDDCWIGPNVVMTNAILSCSANQGVSGWCHRAARCQDRRQRNPPARWSSARMPRRCRRCRHKSSSASTVVTGNPAKVIGHVDDLCYPDGDSYTRHTSEHE
jgi:hypothetical protein